MLDPFILNPFPSLLAFSFFAPTFLRLILGFICIRKGYQEYTRDGFSYTSLLNIFGGMSVFLGAYTQIGSLLVILATVLGIYRTKSDMSEYKSDLDALILVSAVALLILGSGAFGFDLPF
jgi:uncharacterized membrane protein YphA (DoxX/SURF4 family)